METERNDKLARSKHELVGTVKSLAKLSELMLVSELDLTATNSKTVLEPRLSGEFLRVLSEFPAEAVEAAFRGWRDVSPFFPAVSDIRGLCEAWVRRKRELDEEIAKTAEQIKVEAAREAGELVDFADIKRELLAIAQFPTAPTERQERQKAAIERLRRSDAPPALQLTKEQIEARREQELEEIRRYEAGR